MPAIKTSLPFAVIVSLVAASHACAGTVNIGPGDDVQKMVDANPGGTTYLIAAGVYRIQIVPKSGDIFIGQAGAILNGSRLAARFWQETVDDVTYWVTDGPAEPTQIAGRCDTDHPMCMYSEDFFIDNELIQRVGSLREVTSSTGYFDYSAARIYFLRSPADAAVEFSYLLSAFRSRGITNVTIKGFLIEKYAAPAQTGAVSGEGWTFANNEIRFNHAAGIHMNSNQVIDSNNIHHNGQQGVSGRADQIAVTNNEIAFNNTAGFDYNWEAGGLWFSRSSNLLVEGNYIHHNRGLGIHLDYETYNWLVQGNRTKANYLSGIDNEVGYDGTARYNIVENDGLVPGNDTPSMWYGCGIYIYAARNTYVHNNTVLNSTNGICAVSMPRNVGSGNRGAFEVHNLHVHDNLIVQTNGGSAAGAVASTASDGYYLGVYSPDWNNRWTSNIYKLPSATDRVFVWQRGNSYDNLGWSEWRSFGHDGSGTLISPEETEFPSTRFNPGQKVRTADAAQVWSLPTVESVLLVKDPGTQGNITKVAGPILTDGAWWWNVIFTDGTTGWCHESDLQEVADDPKQM